MERIMSFIGCFAIVGTAYLVSNNKKRISWRLVFWGLGLQLFFGLLIIPDSFVNIWIKGIIGLNVSPGEWFFNLFNKIISTVLSFSDKGMNFLLGSFLEKGMVSPVFENIIFRAFPIIIFFSSLITILYHLGIMQRIVSLFALIMAKTMKTSGAESLGAASNMFVGMIESPLTIRPFLSKMTQSELFAIMSTGMATIAGSVMGIYVGMLEKSFPNIAGHLLTASVMSVPAALVLAKMMIPELDKPVTLDHLNVNIDKTTVNVIDAATKGATDGLKLVFNVGAVLLAFVALIYLIDFIITAPQEYFSVSKPLTLDGLAGYFFAPIAFLMGIPYEDILTAGTLLGKKTVLNELLAYDHLANILKTGTPVLKERTVIILSYALCGFANFGSVGIMIGGISGMVPERSKELAKLGLKSLLAGLLAGFMTACIAGIII